MTWFDGLRRLHSTRDPSSSLPQVLRSHRQKAHRAALLLQIAYVFPLYWTMSRASHWDQLVLTDTADRLWPVRWLDWVPLTKVGPPLYFALIAGLTLGALGARWRLGRIAVFVCLLETLALEFSSGKIHHLMHAWLLSTLLWLFLPENFTQRQQLCRADHHAVLIVFSASQIALSGTYTLSGIGKVLGGLVQLLQGQVSVFHPSALARHIADRILQTGEPSVLGTWLVEWGGALWPGMLLFLYMQLFAVWFAFHPRFHHAFGWYLIVFHSLGRLVLTIEFSPVILLSGILFVASPFTPDEPLTRSALRELPLLDWLSRLLSKGREVSRFQRGSSLDTEHGAKRGWGPARSRVPSRRARYAGVGGFPRCRVPLGFYRVGARTNGWACAGSPARWRKRRDA